MAYLPAMLVAMQQEIALKASRLSLPLKSIYFGGGTPSVLSAKELESLLNTVHKYFKVAPDAEYSFEANPENLSESYVKDLKSLGINRLSVGVQSLNEAVLKSMNRSHNVQQAKEALALCHKYFDNFSLDLMYGLPASLGAQSFREDLLFFLEQKVPHISLYNLTVEEHTSLHYAIEHNTQQAPSEEQSREEMAFLIDALAQHAYHHYEVSNASLHGKESRHNRAYWNFSPYIGIGPSAHSFVDGKRYNTVANNQTYMKGIANGGAIETEEILNEHEAFNEALMLGLRQKTGVDVKRLEKSPHLYERLLKNPMFRYYLREELLKADQNSLILQNDGIFLADKICSDLFV